jgi:hypothetical protein
VVQPAPEERAVAAMVVQAHQVQTVAQELPILVVAVEPPTDQGLVVQAVQAL